MGTHHSKDNHIGGPVGFTLRHILKIEKAVNIQSISWSPDGQILAAGCTGAILLWDFETGSLRRTLKGHSGPIYQVTWSPDGRLLATSSTDRSIIIWDGKTGKYLRTLKADSGSVYSLAWSPDGLTLASGSRSRSVLLWDISTGKIRQKFNGEAGSTYALAWSPDGQYLAAGFRDGTIPVWNVKGDNLRQTLKSHEGNEESIFSIVWAEDGQMLFTGSSDRTVRIWEAETGAVVYILEGHIDSVLSISASSKYPLLATKSRDATIRLWNKDTWNQVAILDEASARYLSSAIAFHPSFPILATLGEFDGDIHVWELDVDAIINSSSAATSVHYTNAKVVLVGDTGVGKSGLALRLTGQPFVATESTHGRHVWLFDNQEVLLEDQREETREILLWDLAGQPGYRLVHQLHLNEVALALVVFDARSETDPFAGVRHWIRALSQAERFPNSSAVPIKKFLIAARTDRGGRVASIDRIKELVGDFGFDNYFETSAKEGKNIDALSEAIKKAIEWSSLPKVSSTVLFQAIKLFLVSEKQSGHVLSTVEDLYRSYLKSAADIAETEDLRAQFTTCTGRVESQGLIRRLSFGNLILLQPELLDAYASALVNTAKDEPDGMGTIPESKVLSVDFYIPQDERIKDKEQEKLLMIAMIEDLLHHEIALREQADDGAHIVFPTQFTREHPDLPDPEVKSVIFTFEGSILNIYATLAVRLSHSGVFKKTEMWKNAASYTARVGGKCGMFLREIDEGRGELILFFDNTASEETQFQFDEYVQTHLNRRALPQSVKRRRIFICGECGTPLTDLHVERRRKRGYDWLNCSVCDSHVMLLDREERLSLNPQSKVPEMDRAADAQRRRETDASAFQGKIAFGAFDVFLCHNSINKPVVKQIGERLKKLNIIPWLDEWELRPGFPWQRALEEQIEKIRAAAIFVGKDGIGPWQHEEMESFLRQFIRRMCPVIPVILPDCDKVPKLPLFLEGRTWVDFRRQTPNPMEQLLWGITGRRVDL
jgi:GTPase SAR1 family protein